MDTTTEVETNVNSTASVLRTLVDLREKTIQKSRVAMGLRLDAVERKADQMDDHSLGIIEGWHDTFNDLEDVLNAQIRAAALSIPIIGEMIKLKGVGLILASKVVAFIDIRRANTVSALWKLAGYGMGKYWINEEGKVAAPIKGFQWVKGKGGSKAKKVKVEKIPDPQPTWHLEERRDVNIKDWCSPYNARLKTACYLVGLSFIRCNSPYRQIYDSQKAVYAAQHPEWSKGHLSNAALRKMIKVWLQHLWLTWRTLEGLPVNEPYVFDKLNHTHYMSPAEYGWLSDNPGNMDIEDDLGNLGELDEPLESE